MKLPAFLTPQDETRTLCQIFGTPIVTKGWMSFPYSQIAVGVGGYAWHAHHHPRSSPAERLETAILAALILPGSEWCHNLGHAAAARAIGKPMDALLVSGGMPLCIFYDPEPPHVTPRQHILRSLGGPLVNILLALLSRLLLRFLPAGTMLQRGVRLCAGTHTLIACLAPSPVPIFDGGSILKWSLITRGATPARAEQLVRKVNWFAAIPVAGWSAWFFRRKKLLHGAFAAIIACWSILFATGVVKEKHAP